MKKGSGIAVVITVCAFLGCVKMHAGVSAEEKTSPSQSSEELTPVLGQVLSKPRAAESSDGSFHVNYELVVINAASSSYTIENITIINPQKSDAKIRLLTEKDIMENIRLPGADEPTTTLLPSQAGYVRINLVFAAGDTIPHIIEHIITATTDKPGPLMPRRVVEKVARTEVITGQSVLIGPPVKGGNWIVAGIGGNSYHRTTIMPINGWWVAPERWAVDFLQLDEQNRPWSGDITKNESYPQFGKELIAVSDGVVERVRDGMPDIPPGEMPENMTLRDAAGNYVVQNIGSGYRALYAHIKKGTIRVKEGERVRGGDSIGLLGNSGNTDAPHLHFQIVDDKEPFASDGVPFVIDSFLIRGEPVSPESIEDDFKSGQPLQIKAGKSAGGHINKMPADLSIVDF
ncbi:MAG: M23 family metallopeptidase [PVC group bacterium]